jgi:hypothetical protein
MESFLIGVLVYGTIAFVLMLIYHVSKLRAHRQGRRAKPGPLPAMLFGTYLTTCGMVALLTALERMGYRDPVGGMEANLWGGFGFMLLIPGVYFLWHYDRAGKR